MEHILPFADDAITVLAKKKVGVAAFIDVVKAHVHLIQFAAI